MGFGKQSRRQANVAGGLTKQQEQALQSGSALIDSSLAGYTPDFYNQRAQSYIASQMPGLSDEYEQARSNLQFGLADRGLFKSSVGERLGDRLAREFTTKQQTVADTGLAQSRELQAQVENYRNMLNQQLQQSVSPTETSLGYLKGVAQDFREPTAMGSVLSNLPMLGNALANQQMGTWSQNYLKSNIAAGNGGDSWAAAQNYGSPSEGVVPAGGSSLLKYTQ